MQEPEQEVQVEPFAGLAEGGGVAGNDFPGGTPPPLALGKEGVGAAQMQVGDGLLAGPAVEALAHEAKEGDQGGEDALVSLGHELLGQGEEPGGQSGSRREGVGGLVHGLVCILYNIHIQAPKMCYAARHE